MSAPVMHESDRMIQRWGFLFATALYAASAFEAGVSRHAPDELLNDLGVAIGLAMIGLPVWLPRRFSEGANAAYAYGPTRPILLRVQRVGVLVACGLVILSVFVGWSRSDRVVHRVVALAMAAMAAYVATSVWKARRILQLPVRR